MNSDYPPLSDAAELRRRAEQRLRERPAQKLSPAATVAPEEQVRELELRACEVGLLREELQASHVRFHAVADQACCWGSWLSPEGKILWISDAVKSISGYTIDECLAMPDYPLPIIHPDDQALITATLHQAQQGAAGHELEFRIRRKDGSSGWCAVTWHAVRAGDGRPLGVRTCVRAIDEFKQIEAAWQDGEKRYRAIIESPIVAIGIARGEQVVYANAALLAIFGYDSLEEFARIPLPDHIAPSSRELIAERLASAREDGRTPAQFTYDIVRRDGGIRTLAASSTTLVMAGEICRLISVSDITSHQQAAAALRNTASLLQATIESTADGIMAVDTAGKITSYNCRFMQMLKVPPAVMEARDAERTRNHILDQLRDPAGFLAKVNELYASTELESIDTLAFKDGRIIERHSRPQLLDGRPVGRVWSFRDITGRLRAEETLRNREESLRRIFAASPDAILMTDLQGSIFTCNDSTVAMFGGTSGVEFIGCNLQEILNGLTADSLNADLGRIVDGNAACLEFTIVNRQGAELIIEFSTVALRDERGEAYGRLWLGRDVSKSRALAREVLANQRRYQLLVEEIPAIVYIATDGSRAQLLYVSPQCECLLGCQPEELIFEAEAWTRRVHPEDRKRVEQAYADFVHRDVPFCCEYRMYNRAGGIIWFRDQVRAVYDQDNRVMYRQGVMIEISELKTAQLELDRLNHTLEEQVERRGHDLIKTYAELCRQELFFKTVVEETSDLIMVCDHNRQITYSNRMIKEILGYEPAAMQGRNCEELLSPEDSQAAGRHFRAALQKTGVRHTAHYRFRHSDGHQRILETSASAVTHLTGDRKLLVACRDVTRQRELEESQRAIREQQARLERLASLSALSAGIVHEINQPLHAIRVLVEGQLFWSARGKAITQDDMQQALRGTMAQLQRVDDIVQHIRSFAALDQKVETTACDLNLIVQAALQLLGAKITKNNIRKTLELATPLPLVLGNAHRLEEVVANLLLNAVQAFDQAATTDKELRCRTYSGGDMVVLEIDDNATGIAPEHVGRIFEPLFTTKTASEGMGLGLSLAQTVLGSCGGAIAAENNARGGATFRVRLPAMPPAEDKK